MQEFTDIHTHILPGVDDGAKDKNISMAMLRMAWKDGIRRIVLTPHNKPSRRNVSFKTIQKLSEQLLEEARQEGMEFTFCPGNEIYYRSDMIGDLEEGRACTMATTSYVLVEFNPMDDFDYIRNGIYQVLAAGYRPIIAHVERYSCMLSKPSRVEELKNMGCYIQVNAGSIMGQYGFSVKQMTKKLLKQQLIHFVASDAHDTDKRAPRLSDCAKYVTKKFGESYSDRIFLENPDKMLKDEYI